MKITVVVNEPVVPRMIPFSDMINGQMGFIRDAGLSRYNNKLVMRCHDFIVSIEQHPTYWTANQALKVELLKPGTIVTVTVID